MTETRSSNARKRAKAKARAAAAAPAGSAPAPAKAAAAVVAVAPKGGAKKPKKAVVAPTPTPPVEEPTAASPSPGKKKKRKRVHKRKGSAADIDADVKEPQSEEKAAPPAKKQQTKEKPKKKMVETKAPEVAEETQTTTRKRKKSGAETAATEDAVEVKAGRKAAKTKAKPEQKETEVPPPTPSQPPKGRTTRAALAAGAAVAEAAVLADFPPVATNKSKRKRKAKTARASSQVEEPDGEKEPKHAEAPSLRKSARLASETPMVAPPDDPIPTKPVRRIVSLAKVKGRDMHTTNSTDSDKIEKDELIKDDGNVLARPTVTETSPEPSPQPTISDASATTKDEVADQSRAVKDMDDVGEDVDGQISGVENADSGEDKIETEAFEGENDVDGEDNMTEEIEHGLNQDNAIDGGHVEDRRERRDSPAAVESEEPVMHDSAVDVSDAERSVSMDTASADAADDLSAEDDAMSEASIQGSEVFSLEELGQGEDDAEYGDLGIDDADEVREREKVVQLDVDTGEESTADRDSNESLPHDMLHRDTESEDDRASDEGEVDEPNDDGGNGALNESFIETPEGADEDLTDSDLDEEPSDDRPRTAVLDILPGVGAFHSDDDEEMPDSEPSVIVLSDTESEDDEHDLQTGVDSDATEKATDLGGDVAKMGQAADREHGNDVDNGSNEEEVDAQGSAEAELTIDEDNHPFESAETHRGSAQALSGGTMGDFVPLSSVEGSAHKDHIPNDGITNSNSSDLSRGQRALEGDGDSHQQRHDGHFPVEPAASDHPSEGSHSDHDENASEKEEPNVQRVLFSEAQSVETTVAGSHSTTSDAAQSQIAIVPVAGAICEDRGHPSATIQHKAEIAMGLLSESVTSTPQKLPQVSEPGANPDSVQRRSPTIEYSTTPSKHLIDSVLSAPREATLQSITQVGTTTPVQLRTESSSSRSWGPSFGVSVPPESTPAEESSAHQAAASPLSSWFFSRGPANFKKRVHIPSPGSPRQRIGSPRPSKIPRLDAMGSARDLFGIQEAEPSGSDKFVRDLLDKSAWRSWYNGSNPSELLDPPLPTAMIRRLGGDAAVEAFAKISTHSSSSESTEEPILVPRKRKLALTQLEASIQEEKKRARAFDEELLQLLQGKTLSGKELADEFAPLLPGAAR